MNAIWSPCLLAYHALIVWIIGFIRGAVRITFQEQLAMTSRDSQRTTRGRKGMRKIFGRVQFKPAPPLLSRTVCAFLLCAGVAYNGVVAQNPQIVRGASTAAGASMGGPSSPAGSGEQWANWLSESEEHALSDAVPPPPQPGSPEEQADLAELLALQQKRSPEINAECWRDRVFSYELFSPVYGSNLTPENSPKLFLLMKHVLDVTRSVDGIAKNKYQRLRPFQEYPKVVTPLFNDGGFSYPSGHSMESFALAVTLGALLPEKKSAFLDRASQIAGSRVYAGVHYPSDIKEGETCGEATVAMLLKNASFQKDMNEARSELKTVTSGSGGN